MCVTPVSEAWMDLSGNGPVEVHGMASSRGGCREKTRLVE